MIAIKPPERFEAHIGKMPSVFLGGTIDMGISVDWQKQMTEMLADENILVLNPRRANWDSSWAQTIENDAFRGQVEWELDALDQCDIIAFYFAPGSKSPVTMLELGLHAAKHPEKVIVCAPEGFWRKGNIDIVCKRYGVRQVASLDDMIKSVADTARKIKPAQKSA